MVRENMERKVKEDSQEELKEYPVEMREQKDRDEDREEKEVPVDKMTKPQLRNKLKEVHESAEKNFDLYMRSQAEIENMKKRFQKDKESIIIFSNESLIRQLLAVVDNLEKAITHSEDDNAFHTLKEGVELTLKGFMETLENAGLEKIKAVGQSFDPNFHEAVSEQEDDTVSPGTVIQELQKGYLLNERLVRPAMVLVSKEGS
jgi:molecular chaperone GrpE